MRNLIPRFCEFDPITGAALISGGASLGVNMLNQNSQSNANAANRDIANAQMKWQESMSNTAHQREMADLRAAGLNPILSAGGSGAGTPTGTTAQMQATHFEDSISKGVSSAMDALRLRKELKIADTQGDLNVAMKGAQDATAAFQKTNSAKTAVEASLASKQQDVIDATLPAIKAKATAEAKKAKYDAAWAKEDAILQRTGQATGILNDAVGAFMPKIKFGGSKPTYIDKKTGEILK